MRGRICFKQREEMKGIGFGFENGMLVKRDEIKSIIGVKDKEDCVGQENKQDKINLLRDMANLSSSNRETNRKFFKLLKAKVRQPIINKKQVKPILREKRLIPFFYDKFSERKYFGSSILLEGCLYSKTKKKSFGEAYKHQHFNSKRNIMPFKVFNHDEQCFTNSYDIFKDKLYSIDQDNDADSTDSEIGRAIQKNQSTLIKGISNHKKNRLKEKPKSVPFKAKKADLKHEGLISI